MKETFKTILLIILMITSLVLVAGIWWMDTGISPNYEKKEVPKGTSYLLSDMIMPEKKLISFNDKFKTILYNESDYRLWEYVKEPLREIFSAPEIRQSKADLSAIDKIESGRFVSFIFTGPVNTYILTKALDIEKNNNLTKDIAEIDNITIEIGENENTVFLINEAKQNVIKIAQSKEKYGVFENLVSIIESAEDFDYYYSMKNSLELDRNIYFPYKITRSIPKIYVDNFVKRMDDTTKRNIAQRFLSKGQDFFKEIEETTGVTIYILGNDIVKIDENGTIEYISVMKTQTKNRNLHDSLNTAAKYITEHVVDKSELYLNSVKEIETDGNKGYLFVFEYRIMGYPVLYGSGNYLEMEVFNNTVKRVKLLERRESRANHGTLEIGTQITTPFSILEDKYEVFKKIYMEDKEIPIKDIESINKKDVISWVKDYRLCYYDSAFKDINSELIPVWLFETESWYLGFHAITGNLIYQENR